MATAVVATLGLSCSSNMALASPSTVHQGACQGTQLCAVKVVSFGPQLSARSVMKSSVSPVAVSSGLRVGRSLGHLGSVRHGEGIILVEIIFIK